MTNPICAAAECECEAAGVLAVDVYPYKALMAYYNTAEPVSRLMTTLPVCEPHIPAKVADLFPAEDLERFVATVEASSGVSVDVGSSKVVLVPFTDPDYLRLQAEKEPHNVA